MRFRRLTLAAGVVAALAVAGWYWTRPEPVTVRVVPVERGTVEATVANTRAGTVKAERRAQIAPATSGQVVRLPVSEGDRVEAGGLLLELWNDDLRAERAQALARARAAQARADQVCTQAENARREATRIARLQAQGSVSDEVADRAASERDAAAAGCRASRAEAEMADHSVAVIAAALERTRLVAPFTGVVAEVNAELGEIVTPSPLGVATPPAVDLIDPGTLYVSAPIDEVDAPAVTLELPARITLDAFPGRDFSGRVTRIAPYVLDVEKQARTVEVEVAFVDPPADAVLLPGYSADAEIIVDVAEQALRVPSEAVLPNGRVRVLDGDGIIVERTVQTGIRNWEYTQVTEGLEVGERVIVGGGEGVEPGARAVPAGDATP